MLLSKFLVSMKILQQLGVRKDTLDEQDMACLLYVEDIIIHDNYPYPSLVNTNTDSSHQVFTTNAWKKLLYYISYHLQSSSRLFQT